MKIISISGLDGSGKSTQIQLLKNYLESQGKRVFYFHAIQFGIAQKIKEFRQKYCPICIIMKKCKFNKNSSPDESVTKSGKIGIILRKIFLPIDICRFGSLVKKLEKEGFDYIISDRYFYDGVVNIEYLNSCHSERAKRVEESNIRSFDFASRRRFAQDDKIKPDIAIYLQTDPKTIMQREQKPDQGIEYLQKKKEIFDKYTKIWNLKVVDGNRSQEEVFEEIKKGIPVNTQ